jgi:hypothetical protein
MDAATAEEIVRRNAAKLMAIDGVHGVGLGADQDGPVMSVFTSLDASQIENLLPTQIEGLPVRTTFTEPFKPY